MPTTTTSASILRDIATAEEVAMFLDYRQYEAARSRIGDEQFSGPLRDEYDRQSQARGPRDPYVNALGGLLLTMQYAYRRPIASAAGAIRGYCETLRRMIPNRATIDAASHNDAAEEKEEGISLRDIALHINDGDQQAAKEAVNRWSDSKKIKAEPIGQCPVDRRKQLYRLPEILADVAKIENLTRHEKAAYEKALRAKARAPHLDQS